MIRGSLLFRLGKADPSSQLGKVAPPCQSKAPRAHGCTPVWAIRKTEPTFAEMSALLPGSTGAPYGFVPRYPVNGVNLGRNGRFSQVRDRESEGGAASGWKSSIEPCDAPSALLPKKWYAVHTRARHEKAVAAQLRGRGVETYLPLVEEIHRWSDRRKRVQVPLFPGYAFIHACESTQTVAAVAAVEGVVRIVGTHPSGTPDSGGADPNCPSPRLPQHTLCESSVPRSRPESTASRRPAGRCGRNAGRA